MTTKLSTTDKRDLDALVYLRNADQWQKRVTLKDGRRVYGLPSRSRPGLLHMTDGSSCSCEDHIRNGGRCAHMAAAILYRMEQAAALKPRPTYEELFPAECGAQGCSRPVVSEGSCKRHQLVDAF